MSPGRRPSALRPSLSTRRTTSAAKPIPAAKEKRRPLTRPSEIRRIRPPTRASATCRAAPTGSRGKPRPRARTLVPPPGRKPTGASPASPFSTSFAEPSPPKTTIASAPAAAAASSVAWPACSVSTVRLGVSTSSTSRTRCSVTLVENGLTISVTSIIAAEHATTRPRRLRDARSGRDRALLRARLRGADREGRGPPSDGVRREHRLRVPRAGRPGRPHRRPSERGGARGAEAPPRRRRHRVDRARPRHREGRLLPRSGRAAPRSDHVLERRRPAPALRRAVAVAVVLAAIVAGLLAYLAVRGGGGDPAPAHGSGEASRERH